MGIPPSHTFSYLVVEAILDQLVEHLATTLHNVFHLQHFAIQLDDPLFIPVIHCYIIPLQWNAEELCIETAAYPFGITCEIYTLPDPRIVICIVF